MALRMMNTSITRVHNFSSSESNDNFKKKIIVHSGGSRGGFMGSMEPLFWRAAFENTMLKRTTYTTLTLELRTSAPQ